MVALVVALVVAGLAAACFAPPAAGPNAPPALELHFLDVGQGDAVLIRAPGGRAVLYDGGEDGDRLLDELERVGVTALELVVASHNHADHIGGLVAVIDRFRPRFIMENDVPHTTRTYERFVRAIAAAESQRLAPVRRVVALDRVQLTVIPPPGDPALGHNDNSVGLLIEYGEFRATLLGDSQQAQQQWWLEHHADLLAPVDVHKASHHGSRNGDVRAMMDALRPAIVVIGVSADNRYGHPHEQSLALYRNVGAKVYRTDVHGAVAIVVGEDGRVTIRHESR